MQVAVLEVIEIHHNDLKRHLSVFVASKVKLPYSTGAYAGCSSPCLCQWARRWVAPPLSVMYAQPLRRQTYSCLRASPPFGWYQIILLGDRGTRVWTTCPELLHESGVAVSRHTTFDRKSNGVNRYTNTPGSEVRKMANWINEQELLYVYGMLLL